MSIQLSYEESHSPLWHKLKTYLEQRKANQYVILANVALTHEQTQVVRGRVAEIEMMLRLENPQP